MTRTGKMQHAPSFHATLFRWNGPAAWHFVTVPPPHAPPPTEGWGRTPVKPPMTMMLPYANNMAEVELKALWAYLSSLPHVENAIP